MEQPTKKQRDRLKQIQALCEFAEKPNVNGIDVEHIFKTLEESKEGRIWDDAAAHSYQRIVAMSLYFVATSIYHQDVRFEIAPPRKWQEVTVDGTNLQIVKRLTTVVGDVTKVRTVTPSGEIIDSDLPFLIYRGIEILADLPINTLRICGADDCGTIFASLHKNQSYCSVRCRNRQNTYATRRRARETEK